MNDADESIVMIRAFYVVKMLFSYGQAAKAFSGLPALFSQYSCRMTLPHTAAVNCSEDNVARDTPFFNLGLKKFPVPDPPSSLPLPLGCPAGISLRESVQKFGCIALSLVKNVIHGCQSRFEGLQRFYLR